MRAFSRFDHSPGQKSLDNCKPLDSSTLALSAIFHHWWDKVKREKWRNKACNRDAVEDITIMALDAPRDIEYCRNLRMEISIEIWNKIETVENEKDNDNLSNLWSIHVIQRIFYDRPIDHFIHNHNSSVVSFQALVNSFM